MNDILEYILTNYTWILGVSIIILLAVIGNYADKTNFGQSAPKQKEEKDEVENLKVEDSTEQPVEDTKEEKNIIKENLNTTKEENFDNKFDELDQEIEEFLPEKGIIDTDLLDEIDNLSLDKTQKISFDDIPDLDDVELPKIKNLKSTDDDIWKF